MAEWLSGKLSGFSDGVMKGQWSCSWRAFPLYTRHTVIHLYLAMVTPGRLVQ